MIATTKQTSPARPLALSGLVAGILLIVLTSLGTPEPFPRSLAIWVNAFATPAIAIAAAYLLGAFGLGFLLAPLTPAALKHRTTLLAAAGMALLLTYSHLLGMFGLLNAATAWAPIFVGITLFGVRTGPRLRESFGSLTPSVAWSGLLLGIPLCVMLIAASNSPGYLWDSEFGGYDALSYHLQLPQEWLAMGRIRPVHHNVYSYLPGYMEAAFFHIGIMSFAPATTGQATLPALAPGSLSVVPAGLLAETGWRVVACQQLHALMTLFAARTIFAAINLAAAGLTRTDSTRRTIGALVGSFLFLATPWTIVTGTLAYNEIAMIALFAGAVVAVLSTAVSAKPAWNRTFILCAILIGGACGCKPTALLFCGVPIAILLVVMCPLRKLPVGVLAGMATGTAMLSPWLWRNWADSGNPVFPFAASLFANQGGGTGHWNSEQVARFRSGHHFQGTLLDALRLCVLPDPSDPSGARHRGLMHPQWFAFFPIALIASIFAYFRRDGAAKLIGALILIILVQLGLWLTTTHIQSRFLMPMLVPCCMLIGLAVAALPTSQGAWTLGAIATLVQSGALVAIFVSQRGGQPNMLLSVTPGDRTGEPQRQYLAANPREFTGEFVDSLGPEQAVNLALPADAKVYLLGGATPLFITRDVTYNTTWDAWPSLDRLATFTSSGDLNFALVNFGELERLARSGIIEPGWSAEKVSEWLRVNSQPVKVWPELGQVLVKIGKPREIPAATLPESPATLPAPKP
jgi:hypothetical protein